MKFENLSPNKPLVVNLSEIGKLLKGWREEHDVTTFLGAMMTTKGMLILLFSPRFNRDVTLLVTEGEASKALTKVFESLEIVMPEPETGP